MVSWGIWWSIWGPVLGLSALYYCLMTTRDYRKRARMAENAKQIDDDALHSELDSCVTKIAAFILMKPRTKPARQEAENALVYATVLRERIHLSLKQFPLPTYLKSRRQIWAVANGFAKQAKGT